MPRCTFAPLSSSRRGRELASLGMFHVLASLARRNEALRYLSLRESLGFRELFDEMSLGRDIDRSSEANARALLAGSTSRGPAHSERAVGRRHGARSRECSIERAPELACRAALPGR